MMAEMALLRPLLEGEDTGDQLAVMVDMFGLPTDQEMEAMRVGDTVLSSAIKILDVGLDSEYGTLSELLIGYESLITIISAMLVYDPHHRLPAQQIMDNLATNDSL